MVRTLFVVPSIKNLGNQKTKTIHLHVKLKTTMIYFKNYMKFV